MTDAATRLGSTLAVQLQGAADARWLTVGTIATLGPLTVTIDGAAVPATTLAGLTPSVDEVVLVAVLRGSPSVSYVVLGVIGVAVEPDIWLRHSEPVEAEPELDGDAVTTGNTGGDIGDAFDIVDVSGGGALIFDDTQGPMAYKVSMALNGPAWLEWTVHDPIDGELDPPFTCGGRAEFYLTAYSDALVQVLPLLEVVRGSAADVFVYVDHLGALRVSAGGTVVTSPSSTVPLNQWFRVEFAFDFTSGAGTYEVALFDSVGGTTAAWTDSGSHSWPVDGGGLEGRTTGSRWGATVGYESRDLWMGNIVATGTAALPGPAA